MATEKMVIMATGCGVHFMLATAMEKMSYLVLSVAIATTV